MQKLIALLAFATVCTAQFTGYSYSALAPVGITNVVEPYKTVTPYMYSHVVPHHAVVAAPVDVAKSAYVKDVFTYPYTYNYNYNYMP
ncbi:hypothetical protein, partial [Neisseria meningitidis]|uniref:hypothetical protein n=1 Tax=Neisseria meningitidis TaxID=487 RepID=UPI001C5A0B27